MIRGVPTTAGEPRPQEHCGHECVCEHYHSEDERPCNGACRIKITGQSVICEHDTRSHSSAGPVPLAELSAINERLQKLYPDDFALQLNAKQLQQQQKQHDAEVALAVLDVDLTGIPKDNPAESWADSFARNELERLFLHYAGQKIRVTIALRSGEGVQR